MTDETEDKTGASERGHHAGGDAPVPGRRRRMSTKRKQSAVLRLLKGEPIELVSRELGVTAADLAAWRDAFLAAGEASLKTRPADERDAEIARLKGKVGDLTMSNELLVYSDGYRLTVPLPGRGSGGGGLRVKRALGRLVRW